jgi:hypothetical protein
MRYLIAGMNRSGSTWLYNVVRLLLVRAGAEDLGAGWVDDRGELLRHRTVVLKVHVFDPTLLVEPYVVLTSHRDLRDVAASLARKFKLPATLEMTRFVFEQYERWAELARFDMRYEDMLIDPAKMVGRVADAIGLAVGAGEITTIADEVELSKTTIRADSRGFDPKSLLHAGHITNGRPGSWTNEVSGELARQIVATFGSWMRAHGYS